MIRRTLALALCFALVLLPGLTRAATSGDDIPVAIVNDDTITTEQMIVELGRMHSGHSDTTRTNFSLERLVSKLVNDRLLIQDARTLQMDQEPEFLQSVDKYRWKHAAAQVQTDLLPDTFSVSDSAVADYYAKKFRRVRFFTLTTQDQKRADSLAAALRRGAKLEEVTSRFAADLYRFNGGDQGLLPSVHLEAYLRSIADSMSVGDVRGPLKRMIGFTVVKLLETAPADSAAFPENRGGISAMLRRQKAAAARDRLIADLKLKYPVVVNDGLLRTVVVTNDSTMKGFQDSARVVATVGGDSITDRSLVHTMMRRGFAGSGEAVQGMKTGLLEDLVQDKLFLLEAKARNYGSNPFVVKQTTAYQDSLLLMDYLDEVIASQVKILPAEEDSFYNANLEWYRAPGQVKISRITTTSEDSAKQVLDRLKSGAEFAWLARDWSVDDKAAKGGDAGWMSLEAFSSDLRDKLTALPLGEVLGPYISMDGYTIIKVTDRKPGEIRSLAQVKNYLDGQIFQVKFNQQMDKVLAQLKANAHITINHDALNNLVFDAKRGK